MSKWTDAELNLIRRVAAINSTDEEFATLMYLAEANNLDPLKKEIWFVKNGPSGRSRTMTSRDGYLKIAQSNTAFKGLRSGAVCEKDEFEIDLGVGTVTHKIRAVARGKIVGGWAICYKDGCEPVATFVTYDEIAGATKGNPIWNNYPSDMIAKNAEVRALKKQFGISGLLTDEEVWVDDEPNGHVEQTEKKNPVRTPRTPKKSDETQMEIAKVMADEKPVATNPVVIVSSPKPEPAEPKADPVVPSEPPAKTLAEAKAENLDKDRLAILERIGKAIKELGWEAGRTRAFLTNKMHIRYVDVSVDKFDMTQLVTSCDLLEAEVKAERELKETVKEEDRA